MNRFPMNEENYRRDYRMAMEELVFDIIMLDAAGFDFLSLPQDVLDVYYNDLVIVHLGEDGCKNFAELSAGWHPYTRQGMMTGLARLDARKTSELVSGLYEADPSTLHGDLDEIARKTMQDEAVEHRNAELLWTTDRIAWKSEDEVETEIGELALSPSDGKNRR